MRKRRNGTIRAASAVLLALALGCGKSPGERRGYEDDSKIGTGMDLVDGAVGGPLRALREAEILKNLIPINEVVRIHWIETGEYPKDLEEVKTLWKRQTRRKWPAPPFRYKYTYDPARGKVDLVHKRPEEYTPEERKGGSR